MLIHLYNGKEPHEFVKEYKTILDLVIEWWIYKNIVTLVKETHRTLFIRFVELIQAEDQWYCGVSKRQD